MASGTINTTSVNLRDAPATSANILTVLVRGSAIETLTGNEDGTWLLVTATVDGVMHVGWVQSQFISTGLSSRSQSSAGTTSSPPPTGTLLRGDGSFSFTASVVGDDIQVHGVTATWFGGTDDPNDNGQTASGVSTRDDPAIRGCALPMDGFKNPKTDGSPIPKLPWQTLVSVTNIETNARLTVPLIDLGPSKLAGSHAALDLTKAAFKALGGDPQNGIIRVDYTIGGGARHLPMSAGSGASLARSESTSNSSLNLGGRDADHGQSHDLQKPPVKSFIRSPNFSSRNGVAIDMVVMHFTDGSSAQGAINRFLNPLEKVSAHYIIERNGDIFQMVEDSEKAWHAKASNPRSIGIEHVALPGQDMTDDQKASSVALVQWIAATYRIKPANIVGHRFAPGNEGTTDCPSHLFGEASKQAVVNWVTSNIAAAIPNA